jgi:hypothetical protein
MHHFFSSDFLAILQLETDKFPCLELDPESCNLHSKHHFYFLFFFGIFWLCLSRFITNFLFGKISHGTINTATCLTVLTKVVALLFSFINIYK